MKELNKKDIIYCCRIFPTLNIFEINECTIRTIEENYFVATDKKTKQAYMFRKNDYGVTVFDNRKEAVNAINDAKKSKKLNNI